MESRTPVPLNGLEKAAAMLICLGVDQAAQVIAHLSHEEIQILAEQMARTRQITGNLRERILEELRELYMAAGGMEDAYGGLAFVQRMLSETFGEERASIILDQITQRKSARPFSTLRSVEGQRLVEALASEHPSIIALVLNYLPREKAAQVLAGLAEDLRAEVVMRLVALQPPLPQMVTRLEQLLAQRLSEFGGSDILGRREFEKVNGTRSLIEILGHAQPAVERHVYEFLQERDPALAEEVRKTMFVFTDLVRLDKRALQLILRELPTQELALALKGAPEEIKELIFGNVSENSARIIKEELELLGPTRLSVVEEAQQKVVATVRRLAEEGTIEIRPAGETEEMV